MQSRAEEIRMSRLFGSDRNAVIVAADHGQTLGPPGFSPDLGIGGL